MGTWGVQFDENDQSADWLDDFADAPSWEKVKAALQQIETQTLDHPDFDRGECAIAAAEIVAAGLGKESPRLPEMICRWAKAHASEAERLKDQAQRSIRFVAEESELRLGWFEADDAAQWQKTLENLKNRLT